MAQHASLSVMLWIKSGTSESEAGKGERISAIVLGYKENNAAKRCASEIRNDRFSLSR